MINKSKVLRSYNGKSGCMCGCLGRYSLPAGADLAAANKATGWDAYDASDIRPRAISMAVNKLNNLIDWDNLVVGKSQLDGTVGVDDHGDVLCYWYNDGDRTTVVYAAK